MNRKIILAVYLFLTLSALAVYLFLTLSAGRPLEVQPYAKPGIVNMSEEFLDPILSQSLMNKFDKIPINAKLLDKSHPHPLLDGCTILRLVRDANLTHDPYLLKLAKEYLDWLANDYPTIHENENIKIWKYNFKHRDIPAGWWSGMSNSSIALAFRAGWELFGDPLYKENYKKAMNGVLSSVNEGGCSILLSPKEIWICEYAWPNLTKDDSFYVLNGSLFALLAVRAMAVVCQDSNYLEGYRKALDGYKKIREQFYLSGNMWTYYMLNPPVTEATHYAIYDIRLLNSLFKITNDKVFKADLDRRRNIFKVSYPVLFNKDNEFLFSGIGFPNPYWLDTYPIEIKFKRGSKIVHAIESENFRSKVVPLMDRAFFLGKVPENSDKFEVSALYGNDKKIVLYESIVCSENNPCMTSWDSEKKSEKVTYSLTCLFDAENSSVINNCNILPSKVTNHLVGEHYSNNQARIAITFKDYIDWRVNNYLAIKILSTEDVSSVKLTLIDNKGNSCFTILSAISKKY